MINDAKVTVVGGGLAGSETAYYLASRGVQTTLIDMKPNAYTPAHESPNFGELVCSNSLKSDDPYANACGLLKAEMRKIGSLTMQAAEEAKVPAGAALAVDRERFSAYISEKLRSLPNLTILSKEVTQLPTELTENEYFVVATGPLTSEKFFEDIARKTGGKLHFYDASAPIVSAESVDKEKSFVGDRYGKGTGDYLNCPMTKEEYDAFLDALLSAERAVLHHFEKKEIFEGCMPVEVMASRGRDTLRFGTLKPVGLGDEDNPPYAVLQLRKENVAGDAYNLVGFQTNLKFPEQKRVFSMIPALHNADFLRYGVMHKNSYVHSPSVLTDDFSVKNNTNVYFAGQITGVEGYVESAMSGLLVGVHIFDKICGRARRVFPETTVCGGLSRYIATPNANFQPMNANFGVLAPLTVRIKNKKDRYRALAERALCAMDEVLGNGNGEQNGI